MFPAPICSLRYTSVFQKLSTPKSSQNGVVHCERHGYWLQERTLALARNCGRTLRTGRFLVVLCVASPTGIHHAVCFKGSELHLPRLVV